MVNIREKKIQRYQLFHYKELGERKGKEEIVESRREIFGLWHDTKL